MKDKTACPDLVSLAYQGARALGEESERPKNTEQIGISEVGRCMRQTALKQTPGVVKTPRDDRTPIVFDDGRATEAQIIRYLEKSGVMVTARQLEVRDGSLVGHIDGIIRDETGAYVLEVKSINTYGFGLVVKNGVMAEQPEYAMQGVVYATILSKESPHVRGCIFVLKDKDKGLLHQEFLPASLTALHAAQMRAVSILASFIPGGSLPDREYDPIKTRKARDGRTVIADWHCDYCDVRPYCLALDGKAEPGTIETVTQQIKAGIV